MGGDPGSNPGGSIYVSTTKSGVNSNIYKKSLVLDNKNIFVIFGITNAKGIEIEKN